MTIDTILRRTTASFTVIAALAAAPVAAQDTQDGGSGTSGNNQSDQASATSGEGADTQGSDQSSGSDTKSGSKQALAPDQVIASVGDADITGADLTGFIDTLPPRMRQQPPQMLMSMGLQQLVLRELLLQRAMAENLGEDPEVVALVEDATDVARDDAMVRVLLQRELESRVTDDAVQQAYDQAAERSDQELPPLEQVRAQIEQQLQRQAVQSLRQELASEVDVIVYGPDGEPVPSDGSDSGNTAGSEESADADEGGNDGSSTSSDSSEGSSDDQ